MNIAAATFVFLAHKYVCMCGFLVHRYIVISWDLIAWFGFLVEKYVCVEGLDIVMRSASPMALWVFISLFRKLNLFFSN